MEKWMSKTSRVILGLALLDGLLWLALLLLPGQPFELAEQHSLPVYESAVAAGGESGGLFGNITVETEQQVSAASAQLLINGQVSGDFAKGQLTVRVYPGDIISVDASAYKRPLSFRVVSMSAGIDGAYLSHEITNHGDVAELGTVIFK